MTAPIVQTHSGIWVVRDDLHPGGTKARFIGRVFDGVQEAVYASPPEGGAQTALAHVARALGKKATIFVAQRAKPHARTLEAARLGAKVVPVSPGYLTVVQSRARQYCRESGASLIPFGADIPGGIEAIAAAALATGLEPDEVWCAAGSGVLARGLALAWPKARRHVVQIGRELAPKDVAGARIHVYQTRHGFAHLALRRYLLARHPAFVHRDPIGLGIDCHARSERWRAGHHGPQSAAPDFGLRHRGTRDVGLPLLRDQRRAGHGDLAAGGVTGSKRRSEQDQQKWQNP